MRSWVSQHFCEKNPESLENWFWNFVPAAEPVPFDRKTGLAQCVAKSLRSTIGQDLILHPVAVEDREAFAFRHEGIPDRLREQIPGELHQSRIGAIRVEHRIAREHGALGKSAEHCLARICAECAFDFFQERQHGLAHGSQTFGNLLAQPIWNSLMPKRKGLPVFQSHGMQDEILPYVGAEKLRDTLTHGGLAVDWHSFRGGHEIPKAVLQRLGTFITKAVLHA